MKGLAKILSVVVMVLASGHVMAYSVLPADVQAKMILKVLSSEEGSVEKEQVSVYVQDAPEVAAELEKLKGRKYGKVILKEVIEGSALPEVLVSAVYIGSDDKEKYKTTIDYTIRNNVMSISGLPSLIGDVSMCFVLDGGKPHFILDEATSSSEDLRWNKSITKLAGQQNR